MTMLSPSAQARLASRAPLPLDPQKTIAIKRNVHVFEIDVRAPVFARAFHEVMIEPGAYFKRIQIKRDPARLGKPFEPGERFHGCMRLEQSFPALRGLLQKKTVARVTDWIEDALLSDYAEIVDIVDRDDEFVATYRYLQGSPIGGSSTFRVTKLGSHARFEAVFHYQEISSVAVLVLQQMAARFHDDVVVEQVHRAASRAGGRVIHSTMDVPVPT